MSTWWINGQLREESDATIGVTDHGVTVGDGCFETTSIIDHTPFAMTRHLARLRRSLAGLGLCCDRSDQELIEAAQAVADANPDHSVLRLTVTAGPGPLSSNAAHGQPTVVIGSSPGRDWPPSASVATVPWTRNERSAVAGIKSTSYAENVVALAFAQARDASEAIFANTVGQLCEGTGSNIFVELDGQLVTPPLSSGCLAGITRQLVLERTDAAEVDLPYEILRTTSEAFLTSSTRDVMPITRIDDRQLEIGPLSAQAATIYKEMMAATADP